MMARAWSHEKGKLACLGEWRGCRLLEGDMPGMGLKDSKDLTGGGEQNCLEKGLSGMRNSRDSKLPDGDRAAGISVGVYTV